MIDDALDDLSRAVTTFGLDPVLGAVVSSLVSHDDRWAADPRWYEPFGTARIPSFTVTDAVDDASEAPSELLGALHEGLRSRSDRRRNGAVYTPAAVADRLVDQAFTGLEVPRAVCDPAAGGGAFLLAAARALRDAGVSVDEIVAERLWGADIDSSAVAVARTALALWAWQETGEPMWVPTSHLVVADPLVSGRWAWPDRGPEGFDAVVGNPPFQGQLHADTARRASGAQAIATRLGLGRLGYADTAALFLVLGCELVRPGGRVALIQPQSVLAARDAAGVRRAVGERADLLTLWVEAEGVFEAEVRVWAPVLERRAEVGIEGPNVPIRRVVGSDFRAASATSRPRRSHGSSWAPLLADLLGGPPLDLEAEGRWSGRLVDLATATAGFRDQFYGLVPYVVDASTLDETALRASGSSTHVPLITAGAIDPLRSRWGLHPARFAGQSWPRPLVDREALARGDAKLSQWVDARLVPKVLVAPQTAVLEVLPDPDGCMVPSTPVVAVAVTDPDAVDLVAAVLASPPASAWVFRQSAGTGLSSGALRVPARTMLQIPLPADGERWAEGARLSREALAAAESGDADGWHAALDQLACTMTAAYGLPVEHDVVGWWRERRPAWR